MEVGGELCIAGLTSLRVPVTCYDATRSCSRCGPDPMDSETDSTVVCVRFMNFESLYLGALRMSYKISPIPRFLSQYSRDL